MLFSRKSILTKGRKPLYAVSRVINASCGSASSTFARCWVHSTNKTSALLRTVKTQGLKRAYSTSTKGGAEGASGAAGGTPGGFPAGAGVPFYRASLLLLLCEWQLIVCRSHRECMDGDADEVVSVTPGRRGDPASCHSIQEKGQAGSAGGGAQRRWAGGDQAQGAVACEYSVFVSSLLPCLQMSALPWYRRTVLLSSFLRASRRSATGCSDRCRYEGNTIDALTWSIYNGISSAFTDYVQYLTPDIL